MKRTEKEFVCTMCGGHFLSVAHHAQYCEDCRNIRQKQRNQEHLENIKNGKAVLIGGIRNCVTCGKPFRMKSAAQRYCSDECKPKRTSSSAAVCESRRKNSDTFTFYLPKGSRVHLSEAAEQLGMTLSDLLRCALYSYLEKEYPQAIANIENMDATEEQE